jgi:hypothetical protein
MEILDPALYFSLSFIPFISCSPRICNNRVPYYFIVCLYCIVYLMAFLIILFFVPCGCRLILLRYFFVKFEQAKLALSGFLTTQQNSFFGCREP